MGSVTGTVNGAVVTSRIYKKFFGDFHCKALTIPDTSIVSANEQEAAYFLMSCAFPGVSGSALRINLRILVTKLLLSW